MTEKDFIDLEDLPPMPRNLLDTVELSETPAYQDEVAAFEYKRLSRAVRHYGSQRKAARALGISQSTLSRKLKK